MPANELSSRVKTLVRTLFKTEVQEDVERLLLEECTGKVPGWSGGDDIQIAALKVSKGDQDKLLEAVMLAQTDWRDLYLWEQSDKIPLADWLTRMIGEQK